MEEKGLMDDFYRALDQKRREEGFAHEVDLPPLPVWALLLLIGGLGTLFVIVWPFDVAMRLCRRLGWPRRWAGRPVGKKRYG